MSAARIRSGSPPEALVAALAPDLLSAHSADGVFLYASDAATQLLGFSPGDLVGRSLAELVHPRDRAMVDALVRQPGSRGQLLLRRADGSAVRVELRTSARQPDGTFVAVARDITEQHRREDALVRANERLAAFASTAAHDLKSPLNTIIGFSQLLLSRYAGVLAGDGRRHVDRIVANAARMSALIDDLLLLSNLESPETTFSPVPLGQVVERVREALDRPIRETGARLEVGELPTVFGNHGQLEHLFQNLIANALKFRGDGSPTIRVTASKADEGFVVAVTDNGVGFPAERADQIFQPFVRLHTREQFEGTGLGLSIVSRIAEQHGGRVWAQSKPGQGSTFYALFPRYGRLG